MLAQEVGEVVVGIETERSDEDRSFRVERRGGSEGQERLGSEEFRRWCRSVVEKALGEDKVLLFVKHEGQTRYGTVR